jgi:hypothetical protein
MAEYKDDKWLDHLTQAPTQQDGEIIERRFSASGRRISVTDAVFGDIQEGGPNVSRIAKLDVIIRWYADRSFFFPDSIEMQVPLPTADRAPILMSKTGWLDGNSDSYDEDTNRTWRAFNPAGL